MAGDVTIAGRPAAKPGQLVRSDADVVVREPPRFVSRGGIKLDNALGASAIEVAGRRAVDVGASTGGFTDCLLQRGAAAVVAVDVGYGELDWRLRQDARVMALERTNARHLAPGDLPYAPDLAVIDVSFISLAKVLPAVLSVMAEPYDALALVKPQFEAGREQVGRGGVVRDPAVRRAVLERVALAARELGAAVLGMHPSGLPGPKGNRETFIALAEPGRAGAADEHRIRAMAAGAEPGEGAS